MNSFLYLCFRASAVFSFTVMGCIRYGLQTSLNKLLLLLFGVYQLLPLSTKNSNCLSHLFSYLSVSTCVCVCVYQLIASSFFFFPQKLPRVVVLLSNESLLYSPRKRTKKTLHVEVSFLTGWLDYNIDRQHTHSTYLDSIHFCDVSKELGGAPPSPQISDQSSASGSDNNSRHNAVNLLPKEKLFTKKNIS